MQDGEAVSILIYVNVSRYQCRDFRFCRKYGLVKHCAERPCASNLQLAIDV